MKLVSPFVALVLAIFIPSASPLAGERLGFSSHVLAREAPKHKPTPGNRGPTYLQDVLPILMGKCARCHNDQNTFLQNWLDYRIAASDRWEIKRRVWDCWHGAFFKQPMPTGNSPESQVMTEEERRIIRDWVEKGAAYGAERAYGVGLSKAERIESGKRLFSMICAACHQINGQGIPARFPPLAGSDFLNADKHRAIKVVISGLQGEVVVNGRTFNNSMPRLPLSDEEIASALTFVYSSFGNSGQEVTPEEVRAARTDTSPVLSSAGQIGSFHPLQEKSPWE